MSTIRSYSWAHDFCLILSVSLKGWRRRQSNWVSQLIFSICVLVLFPFAFGPEPLTMASVRWGGYWAVQEFMVAMVMQRLFFVEQEAQATEFLFAAGVKKSAFFLAKVIFGVCQLCLLQIFVTFLWVLLFNVPFVAWMPVFNVLLKVLPAFSLGTASLGCIVYGLTLRSLGREVLFPVLFFPLQFALVLACVSLCVHQGTEPDALTAAVGLFDSGAWTTILWGFPVIFCCLGLLFSDQLYKD